MREIGGNQSLHKDENLGKKEDESSRGRDFRAPGENRQKSTAKAEVGSQRNPPSQRLFNSPTRAKKMRARWLLFAFFFRVWSSSANLVKNPFADSGLYVVNSTYDTSLYYIFFPASSPVSSPEAAPTIIWLQGGPGASSLIGLFGENLGPWVLSSDSPPRLIANPHSWNEHFNLLVIDQPAGTGFSFTKNTKGYIHLESEVGIQLTEFLTLFYADARHEKYRSGPLYVAGESYGGKYAPALAWALKKQTTRRSSLIPELGGLIVIDGWVDPPNQIPGYGQSGYGFGILGLPEKDHVDFLTSLCLKQLENHQYEAAAHVLWDEVVGKIWPEVSHGVNPDDVRKIGGYDFSRILEYVSLPEVKALMHTEGVPYHISNATVFENFRIDMMMSNIVGKVAELLNMGLPMLFMQGQFDWEVHRIGTDLWMSRLQWNGQKEFNAVQQKPLLMEKQVVGYLRSYDALHYFVTLGSGHMEPMNQRDTVREILSRFVQGSLGGGD